jgi:dTDP-glucose 4,6-dehydratase
MTKQASQKPILVLASNSFSGSSYIRYLLSKGNRVIGVSRSLEVGSVFRPYMGISNEKNFHFIQVDLNKNPEVVAEIVKQYEVEVIVNFAAQSMVAQSWEYPTDWYQTNLVSLASMCQSLISEKTIKKFIHFTTPEVYGSTEGWMDETFEFVPSTPYAISRAAGDWHLKCLFDNYGFPVIFTRAANVYGPGQQLYRIIPRTILSALLGKKLPLHGGGKSIRSFIHMNDVGSALEAITSGGKNGDTYHISTNQVISIYELIQTIANLLNVDIQEIVKIESERPGKDFAYQLASEKLRSELGWEDKVDLLEGLSETIEWVKLNLNELANLPINYEHKR